MGKLRRERTKYHLKKASGNETVFTEDKEPSKTTSLTPPVYSIPENVFAGIDISVDKLQKSLEETDAVSVKTSKSDTKEKHMPKKEKRKLRHEAFLRKLETVQQRKKKVTGHKGKQKDNLSGDLKTIVSTVGSLIHNKPKEITKKKKKLKMRSIPKAKHRQKIMLQDISAFRKMLSDPKYKASPLSLATDLIEKKVAAESES